MKRFMFLIFLIGAIVFASPPPTHATPVAKPQYELTLNAELPGANFVIDAPCIDQPMYSPFSEVPDLYAVLVISPLEITNDRRRLCPSFSYHNLKYMSQLRVDKRTVIDGKKRLWVRPVFES